MKEKNENEGFKAPFEKWGNSFGNSGFMNSFRKHGGMRYYVLWLLSRNPLRGSEIMSEIQRQTFGWWKPSPGTIYPLLGTLQSEGLIMKREDMRFEMTSEGYAYIGLDKEESNHRRFDTWNVETIIREIESNISFLEEEKDSLTYEDSTRIENIMERFEKLRVKK